MKKTALLIIAILTLICCQESLENRAERESREFTKKNCPYQIDPQRTLDSMTFDKKTLTFSQYETIRGIGDDAAHFDKIKVQLRNALVNELHNDTNKRNYKKAGYSYRYVMRSESTGQVLFETTINKMEYI